MKKAIYYCLILAMFLVTTASTCKNRSLIADRLNEGNNFIQPIDFGGVIETKDSLGTPELVFIREATNTEILNYLTDEASYTEETELDVNAKGNYGGVTVSSKNTTYRYILDYGKFSSEPVYDTTNGKTNKLLGFARIGVGLRIFAQFTTTKNNLDVSNIIAMAASASYLHGSISVYVEGIQDPEITKLFPITKDISIASISDVITALHDIKDKIYTAKMLRPRVLGLKCEDTSLGTYNLMLAIVASKKGNTPSIDERKNILTTNKSMAIPSFSISKNPDVNAAKSFESTGYKDLIAGDFEQAYKDFIASENSANGYQSSYEIAKFLSATRKKTGSWVLPDETKKDVFKTIAQQYSDTSNKKALLQKIQ